MLPPQLERSTTREHSVKIKSENERFYNPKTWCDALDYTGVWRLGRIKKSEDNYILVLFDGWSEKWKQWYCKHSPTIAPVRTHTYGYTGQVSVTLRDYDFQVSDIMTHERKLKNLLIDDKLSGFDAFRLASFIRGDLFVLIDSILTLNDRIEAQECHQISSFMRYYINMALRWMNMAIKTYQSMRKEVGPDNIYYMDEIRNRKLHVNSDDISLYTCGFEIFLSLRSIFGLENRSTIFYEKNALTLNSKDLIAHFLTNEGLHKLNELISYEDKELPNGRIDFMLLWPVIYSVPNFLNKAGQILKEQPVQQFITAVCNRLKLEFESDPLFKPKFEKNGENIVFIDALGKLNSFINGGELQLGTLFDNVETEDNLSLDLNPPPNSIQTRRRVNTLLIHTEDDDSLNKEGSVIIKEDEKLPKMSHEASTVEQTQEVLKLKDQLKSMENQMLDLLKGLDNVKKGQKDFKQDVQKSVDEKIEASKKAIQKKDANEPKNEYFTLLKNSGITPKELETYLAHFKQMNQAAAKEQRKGSSEEKSATTKYGRELEDEHGNMGTSEDEIKVLGALEMNLSNNKLGDALKLIRWRKKVIKLAQMNGWEVASIIANKTIHKLDVDAADIIMANVSFLQRNSSTRRNHVGSAAERPQEEDEEEEEEDDELEVQAKPHVKIEKVANGRRNDRYSREIQEDEGL